MSLKLSQPLPQLVEVKYKSASASESLSFARGLGSIIHTHSGIPFQLRYCPSLAKKPTPNKPAEGTAPKRPKSNPFENPDPELFITDIPNTASPTHFLILNKFPIIKHHFILATKKHKEQTQVLEEDDLTATHAVLRAWATDGERCENEGRGKRLFAFFNSGEHSGASQRHRHLQFLPEECIREGMGSDIWSLLIDRVGDKDAPAPFLPFTYFYERIPKDPSPSQLHSIYKRLHSKASIAIDAFAQSQPESTGLKGGEAQPSAFSYNLAMTTEAMIICPRRSEGKLLHREDGSEIGYVQFNGTLLAGTLMVKGEAEWDWLRSDKAALDEVLHAVGIPWGSPDGPRAVSTKM